MAVPTTPEEIASSLTIDQIPVKLRCAACTQLAINAFRMPCCDQSICETCHQSLDDACPICLHEPMRAEDCKINKTLRTTIKAFLRKKGVERDQALKKEMASRAPATPATSDNANSGEGLGTNTPQNSMASTDKPDEQRSEPSKGPLEASDISKSIDGVQHKTEDQTVSVEAHQDIPRPSIESGNEQPPATEGGDHLDQTNGQKEQSEQEEQVQQEAGAPEGQQSQDEMSKMQEQWAAMSGTMQGMNNGGFGFDGMLGGFPNMAFNSPADYTQMMQYMQNGMPNGIAGAFPNMMSITGAGMNPMAMAQGMYGGYNGQSMGMNGMNAGMGYANGQGAYGGYNGQTASWNGGQHNYNQNAYGGHANGMVGDYGSNTGYGGYNMTPHQGSFNQMNNRNFPNNDFQSGYHGQGYQSRGRGRGRGYQNYGRGRGASHQVNSGHYANYETSHHQMPQQVSQQGTGQSMAPQHDQQEGQTPAELAPEENVHDNSAETQKAADEFAKSLDPGDAEDNVETSNPPATTEAPSKAPVEDSESASKPEQPADAAADSFVKEEAPEEPSPIETFVPSEPQELETTKLSRVTEATSTMPPPPSPVVPTGPAALPPIDQHQPYEYVSRVRGRGYNGISAVHRGGLRGRGTMLSSNVASVHLSNGHSTSATSLPATIPTEPKGLGVEGAPKGPKAMMGGPSSTSINGGKGFSIVGRASAAAQARTHSQAKSRSPSSTHSRSRSRSPTRSHRHRHHRHHSADSSYSSDRDRKRERHHRRSRRHEDEERDEDASPKVVESSSRRSKHHHRDDDRERELGRSSHRSHRSHRDRSKERDDKHRHSRKRSQSPYSDDEISRVTNGAKPTTNGVTQINGIPPTGPKADRYKIKEEESQGSSRKRREREEEDEYGRDRKRSKPEYTDSFENEDDHRGTRRAHRVDAIKISTKASQPPQDPTPEKSQQTPTPTTAVDPHTLEREARNRERMQKEMQRRSAVDIKGSGPKRKMSGAMQGGRRVSYKYEDEESSEARTSRVENEREASRWG